MSSNSNRKEQEILERQRRLAAQMKRPSTTASGDAAQQPKRPSQQKSRSTSPVPPASMNTTAKGRTALTSGLTAPASRSASFRGIVGNSRVQPTVKLPPSSHARPNVKRPPPPPPLNNKSPKRPRSGSETASAAASSKPPAPVHKRPTQKRRGSAAAALVAAARAKAAETVTDSQGRTQEVIAIDDDDESDTGVQQQPKKKRPSPSIQQKKPSPSIQRKKKGTASTSSTSSSLLSGSLAQLVQQTAASSGAQADASQLLEYQPDDFWKQLREWDVVKQYAATHRSRDEEEEQDDTIHRHKPVPNVFLNARHYTAVWALLQLAECRAQFVQEASLTWNHNNFEVVPVTAKLTDQVERRGRRRDGPVVDKQSFVFDEFETACSVQVYKRRNTNTGGGNLPRQHKEQPFFANDVVLLLPSAHENILQQLSRGQASAFAAVKSSTHAIGLIGHTEYRYGQVDGLVVKVSKRQWAKIGQKDMVLVRLGSNVTALREFTALCRVSSLPLQRFLMGQHLNDASSRRKLSRNQSTQQLLHLMGGTQALGEGFLKYCREKFNASQLTAIAASANEYGEGGFTLIKGPPGTGKTTTLVAVLNSLHIRQYNKYYEAVRRIAGQTTGARTAALEQARKAKPRLLICAPSNAAVDNIVAKIMEDGFIDGQGNRYNPSMIRVGVGKSDAVRVVALETKVDELLAENMDDVGRLEGSIAGFQMEIQRIQHEISRSRRRLAAIAGASPWPLSSDWEIRIHEETFDQDGKVFFVNHREKSTTFEVPPPPEPGESQVSAKAMPEYRNLMSKVVKLVERYYSVKTSLERCTIIKGSLNSGTNMTEVRMSLETHILNSVHMVLTTLGSAGNRTLECADKFEVVVVDEAAQSVEPATLSALQLGSRHAVLVGDPQQLPATIFNVSGRNSKYDRSLFQRLEEAGQPVYMLNEQYRMHPKISFFPRNIFYKKELRDGPNVVRADYGNPMLGRICSKLPTFQPFVILDVESREERGGTSLSNRTEADLAVFLYLQLKQASNGMLSKSKVAIITPYAQQVRLLRRSFEDLLGPQYANFVEINSVDAFQGREANVVIFSAVRAAGSHGIGFLSDVRRMNVALTRAKHMLFVLARCKSIVVNPYWRELVQHAQKSNAVLRVPVIRSAGPTKESFGEVVDWKRENVDYSAAG